MAIISTVVGELNLWENKDVELVESDFDATKKKITLTFLTKDSEGRKNSIDKLKMYGVKDYDETILRLNLIKSKIRSIDIRKENQIGLLDKPATLLQIYRVRQMRVQSKESVTA